MAKILLITPQLPYPPQQGTSLRNWHLLRWMVANHEVTLLSFVDDIAAEFPEQLTSICDAVVTVLSPERSTLKRVGQVALTSLPDMALRLQHEDMADAAREELETEEFDIVQIEGLELAYLIPTIRANSDAAIVLDCHNAETELQRRAYANDRHQPTRWPAAVYSRVQINRLATFEAWAIRSADATVVVSEADAERLGTLSAAAGGEFFVVPNSIDVSEYQVEADAERAGRQFDLVFSGKMDYRPNVDAVLWFAANVWPQLRKTYPDLTWGIVGQRPHKQLDRLRQAEGITITGRVDSVRPYLEGAKVIILPLRIGSGTRLKLIEAMAAERPIVSTTIGAEGFPVISGQELILADTPAELTQAISQLLDDPELRAKLGQVARQFATSYDWRVVAPALELAYQAAIDHKRAQPED